MVPENTQNVKLKTEQKKKKHSDLTCDQTSGTSSQRFWLLCPPAASYRTRTTNASPPAHLLPWQPTLTHHRLNKPQTQARVHRNISEKDPSAVGFSARLACATAAKRITVAWLVLTGESASQSRAQRESSGDPPSQSPSLLVSPHRGAPTPPPQLELYLLR